MKLVLVCHCFRARARHPIQMKLRTVASTAQKYCTSVSISKPLYSLILGQQNNAIVLPQLHSCTKVATRQQISICLSLPSLYKLPIYFLKVLLLS
jgi:hypothetical protein